MNGIRCVLTERRPRNAWVKVSLRQGDTAIVGESLGA